MKKKKYSLGGQLLQTGVSFIPGVGQILAPLVGFADQQMDQQKLLEEQKRLQAPPIKINTNPYGLALGGPIQDGFKQYNTGSHASGGDLTVDLNGLPDPNGQNSVQNKENSFRVDNKQTVFSDVLKLAGKAFSKHAAEINSKYSDSRTDLDQRKGLDFEMKQLSKKNDAARNNVESSQKAFGGPLYNKSITDATNYWKNNQTGAPSWVYSAGSPMLVNPPEQLPQDYKGIEMATDTTQMPGGNSPQLNLGQNLNEIPTPPTTPKVQDRNTTGVLDPQSANGIALGLKGVALAGSIYDALKPAVHENLIAPDYRKSDADLRAANIDFTQQRQDAIGISNIGANTNRSMSNNASSYMGREQSRLAQLQDTLGRIGESENLAKSNLYMQKGQIENNRAIDLSNRKYQNDQNNQQNDATQRYAGRILSSDLASVGSEFNKYASAQQINANNKSLNEFETKQQVQLLNSKYPNFTIDANVMELIKSGASIDEIIKMKK